MRLRQSYLVVSLLLETLGVLQPSLERNGVVHLGEEWVEVVVLFDQLWSAFR